MNENKFSNKDLYYFKKAKAMAQMSTYKRARVGCVAVYKGNIISTGYNNGKTHPLQFEYNKYRFFNDSENRCKARMHAEVCCLSHIIDCDIDWGKVKLYLYRVCNSRDKGISFPCDACMRLIQDLGIKHIYFTTDYGYAYHLIDEYSCK